jgi:hypothetical protein
MGTLDFFLLEAGDILERLDALAQTPAGPFGPADEFVRQARALRGSAIMATQHAMARAAQGLESCARAVREGRLAWSEAVRGEVIRAVDDCKIVLRRLRTPEQGDTELAEGVGLRLDKLSGRASAALRAAAGPGLDAGARAFVAREAAAIASVLQNAARVLRAEPGTRDALGAIGPAMSALRGVAVLNDLPPLGDVLAAVESTVKEAWGGANSAATAEALDAGARALSRAAREVVDAGRPTPDGDEARAFAAELLALVGGAAPAVPVESLFYQDAGPHVVRQGQAPAAPPLARVDMVSQGEYLTAAAADVGRASSDVQRDLRLFNIAASLRPMVGAAGAPSATAIGALAEAVRDAIGAGEAARDTAGFLARLREAAAALTAAQSADEQTLARRLTGAAEAIAAGAGIVPVEALAPQAEAAPAGPPVAAMPPVPVEALAPEAPALAPAPVPAPEPEPVVAAVPPQPPAAVPEPAPAPPPAPAAAPVLGEADLALSYMTLEQLITERGLPLGRIEELITEPTPLPVGAVAAPAIATPAGPDADVVPVESLLYRGEVALRRALDLREEVLAAVSADDPTLPALLHEVFDLIELGRPHGR